MVKSETCVALQDDVVQFCCADAGAGGMGGKPKPCDTIVAQEDSATIIL